MDSQPTQVTNGGTTGASSPGDPFAKTPSVVSISDDDARNPGDGTGKASSAGADEGRGTKRHAQSEAGSGIAKKPKTSAHDKEPKQEETYEQLKERANAKITKIVESRDQLKADLDDALKRLAEMEESRDELRAELIASEQKALAKVADQKPKATREKEWRVKAVTKMKAEVQRDYDEKLAIKTGSMERRLNSKHATAERNLTAKLDDKTEKLEAVNEELRKLKLDSKEEIRNLKAMAKEQAKHGGPKAQQALKECQNDLKDKQKELDTANEEIDALKKQIIHKDALINAERTQKEDLDQLSKGLHLNVTKVEEKNAEWKQRCALLLKDSNIHAQNHAAELRDLRTTHQHELREMDKKWQIQATNSAESQERVVSSQRAVFQLNNANARLMREIENYQKKLQATAAEKRQKEEECGRLLEKFAELGVSPVDVLRAPMGKVGESGEKSLVGDGKERRMGAVAGLKGEVEVDEQQQQYCGGGGAGVATDLGEGSDSKTSESGWSFPPTS
ncbi:hypothetical protein Slin14017_G108880 [Septoria linicola]|nr:hypothetical protein Slin14017_G108880 [Septoria linicola]